MWASIGVNVMIRFVVMARVIFLLAVVLCIRSASADPACPGDQQCFCTPTFSATGPDADGFVTFKASVHGGCVRGASFTTNFPPNAPALFLNGAWQDGVESTQKIDTTCWPVGSYFADMVAHCSFCIGESHYDLPDSGPQHVGFTVARTPTASLSYDETAKHLVITYNYGISQQGQMRLLKEGLDAGPLNCSGGSGTCYVDAMKTCFAPKYKVEIRACEVDPYILSNEVKLALPEDACGAKDSTNCQPQDDCKSCPVSPNPCVKEPINVGSGDVSVSLPLFAIDQPRMPLRFDLSYHSLAAAYPNAITTTMGLGWTHSFNSSLRLADAAHLPGLLMLVTPHGHRYYFPKVNDGLWLPAKPIGSGDQVVASGSEWILVSLDGSQTHFDSFSGRWTSTRDRWGNTISGTYANNLLTTITDSVGRQVTLTYTSGSLTAVQLPTGETWHFDYANGELSAIREPATGGTWRTFEYTDDLHSVSRLLTAVRDAAGILLEGHSYDGSDRGSTSTTERGGTTLVEYDTPASGQARVTETIVSTDNSTTTRVSTFTLLQQNNQYLVSQLAGVCSTCGTGTEIQTYAHDDLDRVVSATDGAGNVTTFSYDSFGNVITKVEAAGTPLERTTTFQYADSSWPTFPTLVTEPSATGIGLKTRAQSWNDSETVLTTTESGKLNATDPAISYTTLTTFDSRHRVISFDGPRLASDVNDVTTSAYYSDTNSNVSNRGRLNTLTNALSQVTTLADYDVFGTARSTTDPNGVVTVRTTDARGRTTFITNQAVPGDANESQGYQSTMTFDARDRLTDTVSPRGVHTRYGYEDGTNLLTDTIRLDLSGSNEVERHHVSYDLIGQKSEEQDQSCASPAATCGSWTTKRYETYNYDSFGRLSEADHGSDKIVYAYDGNGLLTSVQDENHSAPNTTYAYDALRRLTSVTQKLAGAPSDTIATQYGYDAQDNLTSVTDPNGNVTTYSYDDFRRLQKQVSPVTGTTTYIYDPAGNLLTTTDGNGSSTTRIYDALNRPTRSTSTPIWTEVINWTYDTGAYGAGRLASVVDNWGTTTYSHDRRGLLRSEVRAMYTGTFTTGYGYDADGNRSSITYPSGRVLNYTFDFANRPLSASSGSSSYASAATYLPFGPLTSLTFGNGTVKTMQYDDRYRVTRNTLAFGGTTIADYAYASDATGNITQIHDALDASYNRDFGYDDLNRLTAANSGASLWGVGAYHYDRMGNLLSLDLGGTVEVDPNQSLRRRSHQATIDSLPAVNSRHETYAYIGTTPKLATVTTDGLDHPIVYDAAGNETRYFVDRSYGARNELAVVTDSSVETFHQLQYVYDWRGVRVQRFESTTSASNWVSRDFFYSPELQLLTVTRDNGPNFWNSRRRPTTMTVADPMHEIVWLGSLPVAQVSPGDPFFPLRYTFTDHLGTPILQTDPAATTVWRAEHEPYGQVWTMRSGTRTEQPLRLPGQELAMTWEGQEENYNIFRWYRAGWGRYTQADPAGLGKDPTRNRHRWRNERAISGSQWISTAVTSGIRLRPDQSAGGTEPYLYAGDSPLTYKDPLGLSYCPAVSLNKESDYVPAGPPGKTFKGCLYIGYCGAAKPKFIGVFEKKDVKIGCKCPGFCLIPIDDYTGAVTKAPTCFDFEFNPML
jgi:YD repeat-containing protein